MSGWCSLPLSRTVDSIASTERERRERGDWNRNQLTLVLGRCLAYRLTSALVNTFPKWTVAPTNLKFSAWESVKRMPTLPWGGGLHILAF